MTTQKIDDDVYSNDNEDRGPAIAYLQLKDEKYYLHEGENTVGRSRDKNLEIILDDNTVSDVSNMSYGIMLMLIYVYEHSYS